MSCKRFHKYARSGAVLPFVVLIVLLMMVIGLGVTSLGMHGRLFAIRSASKITARAATDAAISDAIHEMNEKLKVKPWDNSTLPAKSDVLLPDPDADASFDYVVSENSSIYSVQGTGRAGSSVHTINTTLRLYSPFDYAMLTRGNIELKNTARVDWINNQPDDWPARIGTLSTTPSAILLKNGSIINGDAMVGVGGNPDEVITSKTDVTITGGTYPLMYEPELPPVVVPDFVATAPSQGIIDTTRTISSSGKYSKINLGNGENLTIDEPVTLYITDTVTMGNSSEIIVGGPGDTDNDASLALYVGKTFDAGNSNGFANNTADARRLKLFCLPTCTIVKLKNASNFYGAIYAPNADITLDNGADVYGSIIGNTFILKNSGTFYYDANLRDRTIYDELVRFTIHRWSED
jgi:hypothetical protein